MKSKVSVLVDVGLVEGEVPATKMADFELAMNTCNTLLKLSEKKVKAGTYTEQIRFPNDSKMFLALTRLIVKGLYVLNLMVCQHSRFSSFTAVALANNVYEYFIGKNINFEKVYIAFECSNKKSDFRYFTFLAFNLMMDYEGVRIVVFVKGEKKIEKVGVLE